MSPRLGTETQTYAQVIIGFNDNPNGEIELSPDNPIVPENTTQPFLNIIRNGGAFGEVQHYKCLTLVLLNKLRCHARF